MKLGWNLRFFQTIKLFRAKEVKKSGKIVPEKSKVSKESYNYFSNNIHYKSNEDILKKFLMRRTSSSEALYCMEEQTAETIVSSIKNDLRGNDVVFEINPGIGLITKQLLKLDFSRIILFENNLNFVDLMQQLETKYPEKLKIFNLNFFQLWKVINKDRYDHGDRFESIFEGMDKKDWKDEPYAKIFVALSSTVFLRQLIKSIIFQDTLMKYGRPELYILITPKTYVQLSYENKASPFVYGQFIVLFKLFFDIETITSVPNKGFIPWCRENPKYDDIIRKFNCNPDEYYLIKAVPKSNLFDTIPKHLLKPLWFFLRNNLIGRRKRVIERLELWIPGCGHKFVSIGCNVYTEFGELTPEEILEIFMAFTQLPQFGASQFLTAVEAHLLRIEKTTDFDEQDEKYEESETEVKLELEENPCN